jgi:hypothetical protein
MPKTETDPLKKAEQKERKSLPPIRDPEFAILNWRSWIRDPEFAIPDQDLAPVEGLFLKSNPGSFLARNRPQTESHSWRLSLIADTKFDGRTARP